MGISEYKLLPKDVRDALPTPEECERVIRILMTVDHSDARRGEESLMNRQPDGRNRKYQRGCDAMNRQGIVRQGGGIVRSETVIAIDRPDTAGCLDHGWQAPSLGTAADVSQLANVARKVRRYNANMIP